MFCDMCIMYCLCVDKMKYVKASLFDSGEFFRSFEWFGIGR